LSTKILVLVDALGNLVRFLLLPGQRGEITAVGALLEGLPFEAFLADKAYDADWLRQELKQRGVEAVIPARAKRLHPAPHDEHKYKWRHLVENFFQRLKEFKRIAMRACKTDLSFSSMMYLAASAIRSR
jgi:transposase